MRTLVVAGFSLKGTALVDTLPVKIVLLAHKDLGIANLVAVLARSGDQRNAQCTERYLQGLQQALEALKRIE